MSMSLRDQLLKAGLVSQKQVKDAERKQLHQTRQPPKHSRGIVPSSEPASLRTAEKNARDHALNRQQQEKAKRKELRAQIKQLIDQNGLPRPEGDDFYNFVDGVQIRRIAVNAEIRSRLGRAEIAVVRHEGRYYLVPAATAVRVSERDAAAVIPLDKKESSQPDDAYPGFAVPDDLIW